ncbi:MAG: glycosyltransferase, partial [candidate division KSB1 bacterium]
MKKRIIRRIKIAHVTGWMHVGGKENGMVNLVNAMPTEIFENHVYVFRAGGILLQRVDREKVHVEELGEKLGGDLSIYTKLAKLFRHYRIDIVHTRSWGTLLEGMIAAKIAGVPA